MKDVYETIGQLRERIKHYVEEPPCLSRDSDTAYIVQLARYAQLFELDKKLAAMAADDCDWADEDLNQDMELMISGLEQQIMELTALPAGEWAEE